MTTDAVSDYAPDIATGLGDLNIGEYRVFGREDPCAIRFLQALDRQFSMQDRNDDVFSLSCEAAINDEEVAVEYAGVFHRFAHRPGEKGGGRVPDEVFVEVELSFDVVVGGARESGRNPGAINHQGEVGGLIGKAEHWLDL